MEEQEVNPSPRRRRPKDSFQKELQAKLRQRKFQGLAVDFSDSGDDDDNDDLLGSGLDYHTTHPERPSAAKRRPNHSADLSRGLGTSTMHTKDLSHILGRSLSDDDDDDEIMAANLGKTNYEESWQPAKTPSPTPGSKYLRKTARNDQTRRPDLLNGRKTPTKAASSQLSLSKEEIIFGRKTPSDGKKSPSDRSQKGEQWQPPNFHSVSTGDKEQSRGSRGVTPVDSSLETVSESPREKPTPHTQRQRTDASRPKPQTRSKVGDKKTPPPHDEHHRTSPSYQKETEDRVKRTTPTLDLFGRSRSAAAQEVDEYLGYNDKEQKWRKTPNGKNVHGGAQSPESKQRNGSPGVRFKEDSRNTPTGRKTPTGQKTPTSGKQSPLDKKSSEKEKASQDFSLLDFLMEDNAAAKPKPQERGRRPRRQENQDILDDIFGSTTKTSTQDKLSEGRRTPGSSGKKTPENKRQSPAVSGQQDDILQKVHVQQKAEDTSSLCDDIPPDPDRKTANDVGRKQTTEKAQADNAIETTAMVQTMKYIEPVRRVRPRTASAKVQHRPKPRYGTLADNTAKSLQELHFNSTGDIRNAVYEEWYRDHMLSSRQKKKEEEKKAKAEIEKKKKENEDKHFVAETSYKAWMEGKKKLLSEEQKEKKEKEKLAKENELKEKEEQKMKSQKLFETWKAQKDAIIKRELHRKKAETKMADEEKKQKKIKEQKERESAHKSWLNRKEQAYIAKLKQKKNEEEKQRSTQEKEKEELRMKEMSAENYYLTWLEEKEKQAKLEKKKSKQRLEDEESKPAWFPASRTIPFGR